MSTNGDLLLHVNGSAETELKEIISSPDLPLPDSRTPRVPHCPALAILLLSVPALSPYTAPLHSCQPPSSNSCPPPLHHQQGAEGPPSSPFQWTITYHLPLSTHYFDGIAVMVLLGTSLSPQDLVGSPHPHLPTQGTWAQSLVEEQRSHVLQGNKTQVPGATNPERHN